MLTERDLEAATDPRRFDHGLEYFDPNDLVAMINEAMTTGGFVDYRRSFDYACDVEATLDRGGVRRLRCRSSRTVRPELARRGL